MRFQCAVKSCNSEGLGQHPLLRNHEIIRYKETFLLIIFITAQSPLPSLSRIIRYFKIRNYGISLYSKVSI